MIRDSLKDIGYFKKYLKDQDIYIETITNKLSTRMKEKDCFDEDCNRWLIYLYSLYEKRIYAMYSYGSSKEEIMKTYQKLVETSFKINEFAFNDVALLTSLAILLDVQQDNVTFLNNIKSKYDGDDILIQFYLRYLEFGKPMPVDDCKIEEDEYVDLSRVLVAPENEKLLLFKDFVKNKWYKANIDSFWHDTHKSDQDTYIGYWAFDCAAVAKILNLNIEEIKTLPYLPIDLLSY